MDPRKRAEIRARLKARVAAQKKESHHLWSAQRDAEGKVSIYRERDEKEEFDTLNKSASRRKAQVGEGITPPRKFELGDRVIIEDLGAEGEVSFYGEYDDYLGQYRVKVSLDDGSRKFWNEDSLVKVGSASKESREVAAACWGLFGASLVDEELFTQKIPRPIVERFNAVAKQGYVTAKLRSWEELETAFGKERVAEVRKFIADGMKTRVISKTLDIPFVVAADVLDNFDNNTEQLKKIVAEVKKGRARSREAQKLEKIYNFYKKTGQHKLAVDEKAKSYYDAYYGAYGEQLTKEVKKRVRADLVGKWLRKNGVDAASVKYWQAYWGDYGSLLTSDVAKKLSPSKKD